jgi:hypothetical protein
MTSSIFLGLGLNKLELAVSLRRAALYYQIEGPKNPIYPMLQKLLEKDAEKLLQEALTRSGNANPTP